MMKPRTAMTDICKGCSKPIKPGEARYTGREPDEYWHYDCHSQKRQAAQPKVNDIVIQMEVSSLGGINWIDLSITTSPMEAIAAVRGLTRQNKGRKLRIVKVIYV